jgi:hypothetical protein
LAPTARTVLSGPARADTCSESIGCRPLNKVPHRPTGCGWWKRTACSRPSERWSSRSTAAASSWTPADRSSSTCTCDRTNASAGGRWTSPRRRTCRSSPPGSGPTPTRPRSATHSRSG